MKTHPTKGNGASIRLIREHLNYQGDDCIPWPFFRNPVNGYGHLAYEGKQCAAHRLMCRLAHGEPPTPQHQAAHSCHVRHCINPRHLSWKTLSQNMLDKRANGTVTNAWWGQRGKITAEQAGEIRALKGQETQAATAARYGITESNVRKIQEGKTWKPGAQRPPLTFKQAEAIRAATGDPSTLVPSLAAQYGVSTSAVYRVRAGKSYKRPETHDFPT